ncbi:MAG: SGNH/GDSL hydrolase family protein [Roseivirga sp.]|nr:SGNH/GDSL hydrolase family protein [Roseivirga sp.]
MRYFSALLLLLLAACSADDSDQPSYSYLALGDSYTIGQSVVEEQRWPEQLAAALREQGTEIRGPVIVAKTGWTTERLISAIENNGNLGEQYDLVSLLIGVNNQFGGRPVSTFIPEFEKLLQMATTLTGGNAERVFVLSIPDYGVTLFGSNRGPNISAEIDIYNTASKTLCDQYGIAYFDITPISRKAPNDPELTASDGLHPSGKMYAQWVDLIREDISKLLNR